ncbi:MAG: DUF4159 domain-containing protein [Candidatus Marinimicrobia bacterium]|nr:DUF4159 domain-containing protein [Candidatus Neomarinimicrobiota bacterium]
MKHSLLYAVSTMVFILCSIGAASSTEPGKFTLARLHYGGGGDWYANPSSIPNLMKYIGENSSIKTAKKEARVKILDEDLFRYPILYMTGHGNVSFTNSEALRLRQYLISGGFLFADDNYGMNDSFRRQMKKVFPDKDLVELPFSHGIFDIHFRFPNGLPKIHEHDGKPPQAFGIFHEGRLVVFFTYESDLGDGWEDASVHNDPLEKRNAALQMGTNVIVWALTN